MPLVLQKSVFTVICAITLALLSVDQMSRGFLRVTLICRNTLEIDKSLAFVIILAYMRWVLRARATHWLSLQGRFVHCLFF